jgi:Ca2+-transporting ATPase
MTVRKFWLPLGEIDATGTPQAASDAASPQLRRLLETAVLCNGATLGRMESEDSGDPMELALLRAGRAAGLERPSLLRLNPEVRKYAFDSSTKMMATVHRRGNGYHYFIKGAPEAVLAAAEVIALDGGPMPLDAAARAEWLRRVGEFGRHGLRVLACATKISGTGDGPPFEDLTFLGLVGLEDPARADVPQAIQACQHAGIRVVMVTGDHAVTARAIAKAVGLGAGSGVLEGRELCQLAEDGGALFKIGIFARVSPAEKLRLVRAYQSAGEIVAMTGDGVNDAPALRQADIGIAMGRRGTDVAREAADMILLDDAFPTIVRSIREGRVIFGNVRRFVAYLLSCNLAEILVIGLAILSTLPLPILPLQILFLNLVTDVFPAFALAMGEGERGVMERPPRDPREPILGRTQWLTIVMQSLALTAGTFAALALARFWLRLDSGSVITVTFLTLAFAQLWHVFNMRGARSDLWNNEVSRNPWVWGSLLLCSASLAIAIYLPPLAQVLGLVRPDLTMWTIILAMSLAPLIAWRAALELLKGRWPGSLP